MSISPVLGEIITVGMITSGADGAAIDADAPGPTCSVFEDAGDTPIGYAPTVVKRGSNVGTYRSSVDCSTANGFEIGKTYEIVGKATVGGKIAFAILERFQIRGYSVDGTNVKDVNGQTASLDTTPAGTLTPGERTAIAVQVKTNVGNDATMGSLGQQSKDMYNTMVKYGGLMITGKVDASPTPTASAFKVTLDAPLAASKTAAGIDGQFCTLRSGGAQTEGNPIATCVINSPTSLSLTFGGTSVFSAAPVANDTVSISE